MMESLEDGLSTRQRRDCQRYALIWQIGSAVCVVLTLCSWYFFGAMTIRELRAYAEADVQALREAARSMNTTCVTSRHAGISTSHYVMYGEDVVMLNVHMRPSPTSSRVVSVEETTHCAISSQIRPQRHTTIDVTYDDYRDAYFPQVVRRRRRYANMRGERALCVQHALDIFRGRLECEVDGSLPRQDEL